jgi:NAD-dependent SIR2 family protein deacetylase
MNLRDALVPRLTACRRKDKISELHGNNNREICKDCGKEYIRGRLNSPSPPINYQFCLDKASLRLLY